MSLNTMKGRYKRNRRAKNRQRRFGRPDRVGAPVTRPVSPFKGAVLYGSRWDR